MIPKGAGSIRGLRSVNTRPGRQTQPEILRRMFMLASEKENLKKKNEWLNRQKEQTRRRLTEIWHALGYLKGSLEKKQTNIIQNAKKSGNFKEVKVTY